MPAVKNLKQRGEKYRQGDKKYRAWRDHMAERREDRVAMHGSLAKRTIAQFPRWLVLVGMLHRRQLESGYAGNALQRMNVSLGRVALKEETQQHNSDK